jgi:hypothetical protein
MKENASQALVLGMVSELALLRELMNIHTPPVTFAVLACSNVCHKGPGRIDPRAERRLCSRYAAIA